GSHTEPLLRASQSEMKAAADLVENEQRPVLMRQISHAFQKAGRWRPEVHRLHDDGGELAFMFMQKVLQRSQIVVHERMRQSPHRLRNSSVSRRAPDVPVLPAVIAAARDSLASGEGPRRAHRSGSGIRPVLAKPYFFRARDEPG